MGKLNNDEIKFILNLEAKGLQAEIGKAGAAVKAFTQENKSLQKEMVAANNYLKETERQMLALERSGKSNTLAYKNLKQTYQETKTEIADYSQRISENSALINKNNDVIQKSIQQLKIEDMTMSQLKKRGNDLQKQLEATSLSASPDEYKKLQKELIEVDDRMGQLKTTGKSTMAQLSSIPGPAGMAAQSLMGVGKSMKLLIANPVGAVIAAIVIVFMAFKKALNSSEEATFKLNQIMAPLSKLLSAILKVVQDLVIGFLNFAEAALSGITWLLEKLPFVGNKMREINETAREAIKLEKEKQELQREERNWIVGRAQLENEIALNRNKAYQKDKYSAQERIEFLNIALESERRISEETARQAKEKFRIAQIEAARAGNTSETEQQLKEMEAAVIRAETEMFEKTRGILEKRNLFILEEKRNAKAAYKESIQRQKDAIDIQLNDLESSHNDRISIIKKNGLLMSKTENQVNYVITRQDTLFYKDRIVALQDYLKKVKDEKLRSEIKKKITADELAIVENQKKADILKLSIVKEGLDKNIAMLESSYNVQKLTFENALADKKITQQQYDSLILNLDEQTSLTRLGVAQNYKDDIIALELETGELKAQAVDGANALVIASEMDAAQKRGAIYEAIVNSTIEFKQQFGLLTYAEEMKLQTQILEDVYKAKKEFLEKEGADTTELTKAFEQAKTNLILNAEQERFNLRQSLGLANWNEELEMQKAHLDQLYKAGLISEEEHQNALGDLRIGNWKKHFDYFSGLAKNAIGAIQDAEISSMEVTYDAKIAAAGDNAEEVERLENEKAQKKLDIEKKYADVNFAIKVSEIIANTTVAIMQGFAQLGPIGGAIAAGLMAATGAAQVVSANAERKKVKAMTLNSTGSVSSQQRVVTGKEDGGYIDVIRQQDNKRFWAKKSKRKNGYFDKPSLLVAEGGAEFVANAAAVSNKSIKPFLDLIDNAQRGGYVEQLNLDAILASNRPSSRGYESGGYVNAPSRDTTSFTAVSKDDKEQFSEMIELLRYLKKHGVKAKVLLSDFQEQLELQTESDKLASKS